LSLIDRASADKSKQQRYDGQYQQNMNQTVGRMVYKETKDPGYYKYDCDQIKNASHGVNVFLVMPE
jgi:hypothetical protein